MRYVLLATAIFLAAGCTDGPGATQALQSSGFRDVAVTGYRYFGCGEEDVFRTGFEATGQSGRRVSGVVCSGFFKGYTVRLD